MLAITTPSASRAARMRLVKPMASGLSPWTQMESAWMGMTFPVIVYTQPSLTMRTVRAMARSRSWTMAPGWVRGTRVPSSI